MMKEEFEKILEDRLLATRQVLAAKREEYASCGKDRLHNFKRAAAMLSTTPEHALVGMWVKHIISILDIVDDIDSGVVPATATVDEKIGDACNYLILLEAALKERIFTSREDS